MKQSVLITGATGMVGKAIVEQCIQQQIEVRYLTTSKSKIGNKSGCKGFYWNPDNNQIDTACFDGVEAIINLAGAPISKPWTRRYKSVVKTSRINSLELLRQVLKKENITIKHLISASAIGVYPHSFTNFYQEDYNGDSSSFLANVVKAWEAAADTFTGPETKVSKIRIGLVLDKDEGVLPKMLTPIKWGLGAPFGTGAQWQSWIHRHDLAKVFLHVFQNGLEGTFNAVAPNPVTNAELVKTIAEVTERPLWLPNIPKGILKLGLGERHELLTDSQRVSCKKIEDSGFAFKYYHIKPALSNLLKA